MLAAIGECGDARRQYRTDCGIGRETLRAGEDQGERSEHTRIYYLPALVLVPKFVTTLRDYDREQFTRDVIAGVIVGIVALPLAIAFAIASGLSPERGLFTAIVAGFLISLLGGSRVQIGGPTGAFVVIVSGIVLKYGVDGLVVATLMAGFILVAFGLLRLGGAIKFIPYPVTIGFTSGIALIIFSSQIRDLLGLEMTSVPSAFLPKWDAYVHAFDTVNPWALVIAIAALAIILVWPKISTRIPGPFVALIVTTALAQLLHLPVETIGARFGEIHAGLPAPSRARPSRSRSSLRSNRCCRRSWRTA